MNILDIKGDAVLKFKSVTHMYCDDGKAHLVVSYVYASGDYGLELEGYCDSEQNDCKATKELTFNNFRRRFKNYKIFFKGNITVGNLSK